MRVPSVDAAASDAEVEAVARVLRSGVLANGEEVVHLEEEFTSVAGAAHAVAVSSGTDALYIAGRALGIGPSSEVLVAGFSFAASANAFLALGATVVPVDVDISTRNMDAGMLRVALEEHPRCAAVVVVDLYGGTAGTSDVLDVAATAGVPVVEDACQAHGARSRRGELVGSRAAFTAFSLYATKNVSAGEGGILTTSDTDLADRCRLLRNHGSRTPYCHEIVGLNHRLPEMSAARWHGSGSRPSPTGITVALRTPAASPRRAAQPGQRRTFLRYLRTGHTSSTSSQSPCGTLGNAHVRWRACAGPASTHAFTIPIPWPSCLA